MRKLRDMTKSEELGSLLHYFPQLLGWEVSNQKNGEKYELKYLSGGEFDDKMRGLPE